MPVGAKDKYAFADGWGNFCNIIEDLDQNGNVVESEVEKLRKEVEALKKEVEALRQRLDAGDVNGDGSTTAADVVKVVNSALKQ